MRAGISHRIPSTSNALTGGRVIFVGGKAKRADCILRYRPDYSIAVVEVEACYEVAADGLRQAKEYAEILGLKFTYRG